MNAKQKAEDYWLSPGVAELTPWPPDPNNPNVDPGARLCPTMTSVYDNNNDLLRLVWVINGVFIFLWLVIGLWAIWMLWPPMDEVKNLGHKLTALAVDAAILGVFSVVQWHLTRKARRAACMMPVLGAENVCGMHDNWPRRKRPVEGVVDRGDEAIDVTPEAPDLDHGLTAEQSKTFVFEDHESLVPGDDQDVVNG